MTLKEQIMNLQTYKMYEGEDTVYVERDDVLKLLEQQTCKDAISREETILHISERLYETAMNNQGYEITMDKACEDIAVNRLKIWINELPSVTPKAGSEN